LTNLVPCSSIYTKVHEDQALESKGIYLHAVLEYIRICCAKKKKNYKAYGVDI
jgi:hypothetical protein